MKRETWKSRIGFIFAALGSAVGLGSIWRFPYIVGENGGAAFIFLYLICLFLIGFPVLLCEILLGKISHKNPFGAFLIAGKKAIWGKIGKLTIVTGFIISSFYSVIAGFSLGYLFQAISGNLISFSNASSSLSFFQSLAQNPYWTIGFHFLFISLSVGVLITGVRRGIEFGSKIMMPMLSFLLLILVIKGLMSSGASKGLTFLFSPDFSKITSKAVLMALGQAFFTLSLGQGTMITYGSYLPEKENVQKSCLPVVICNTLIAICMGIAVFTIVFSVGIEVDSGPALIFETLPIVFSTIPWGYGLSILFFILVTLAALTSEISALEPVISYLIDEKKFTRKKATVISGFSAFVLGVPTALSFGLLKNETIFGQNFYDIISFVSVNILVPLGGLFAVLVIGYRYGIQKATQKLPTLTDSIFSRYFSISVRYIAPLLILLILLDLLGVY